MSSTRPPRVSVLLPARNAERYVEEAVRSILAQTFADFEILVVDDGSTDRTMEVVESIVDRRIRLLRHADNKGVAASLNLAARTARGEFLARMDADDVSHPERLGRQVAYLDARPEIAAVGSPARIVDAQGRVRGRLPVRCEPRAIAWGCLFYCPMVHSSVTMRRSAFEDLGGYAEVFHAEDYELWSRFLRRFAMANFREPLLDWRHWPGSTTAAKTEVLAVESQMIPRSSWRDLLGEDPDPAAADALLRLNPWSLGPPGGHALEDALRLLVRLGPAFEERWGVRFGARFEPRREAKAARAWIRSEVASRFYKASLVEMPARPLVAARLLTRGVAQAPLAAVRDVPLAAARFWHSPSLGA